MAVRVLMSLVCRFDLDLEIIRRKGSLISFGNASGVVDPVPLFKLTAKNVRLLRPTYVLLTFPLDCQLIYPPRPA